ncbi:MAG: hypothetical protein ACRD2L_13935 [Terriglobia bacterium]
MSFPDIIGPLSQLSGQLSRQRETEEDRRRQDEQIRRQEEQIRQQRGYELLTQSIGKIDDNTFTSMASKFNLPYADVEMMRQINKQVRQRQKAQEALGETPGQQAQGQQRTGQLGSQLLAGGLPQDEMDRIRQSFGTAVAQRHQAATTISPEAAQAEMGAIQQEAQIGSLEARRLLPQQRAQVAGEREAYGRLLAGEQRGLSEAEIESAAEGAIQAAAGVREGTVNEADAQLAIQSVMALLPSTARKERFAKRLVADSIGLAAQADREISRQRAGRVAGEFELLTDALTKANEAQVKADQATSGATAPSASMDPIDHMDPHTIAVLQAKKMVFADPAQAQKLVYAGTEMSKQMIDRRSALSVLDSIVDDQIKLATDISREVSDRSKRRNRPLVGGIWGTGFAQTTARLLGLQTGNVARFITNGQAMLIKIARMDQDARLSDFDLLLWMAAVPTLVDLGATEDGSLHPQAAGRFQQVKRIIQLERDRFDPAAIAEARKMRAALASDPEIARRMNLVERYQSSRSAASATGEAPSYGEDKLGKDFFSVTKGIPVGGSSGLELSEEDDTAYRAIMGR